MLSLVTGLGDDPVPDLMDRKRRKSQLGKGGGRGVETTEGDVASERERKQKQ